MKITMNEKRTAVINTLKNATAPMTLGEIANKAGVEIKSGTTNAMVKAGLIVVSGEREIICPACGHKHTVKEYKIGDLTAIEKDSK